MSLEEKKRTNSKSKKTREGEKERKQQRQKGFIFFLSFILFYPKKLVWFFLFFLGLNRVVAIKE